LRHRVVCRGAFDLAAFPSIVINTLGLVVFEQTIPACPVTSRASRPRPMPQECELNPTVPTPVNEFVSCGFVNLNLPAHVRASRLLAARTKATHLAANVSSPGR
jgi:hypothetical protein